MEGTNEKIGGLLPKRRVGQEIYVLDANGNPEIIIQQYELCFDPAVRACQLAAKGLWWEMILLMSQSPRYGYLLLSSGEPPSIDQLTIMVGGRSVEEVKGLLSELERNGVPSLTEDGVYFCRRMVREEAERARVRNAMRKKRGKCDGDVTSKLRKKRSRASPKWPEVPRQLQTPAFYQAWQDWQDYRCERKSKLTASTARMKMKKFAKWGPEKSVVAICNSIENGWLGVFEPNDGDVNRQGIQGIQGRQPTARPQTDQGRPPGAPKRPGEYPVDDSPLPSF